MGRVKLAVWLALSALACGEANHGAGGHGGSNVGGSSNNAGSGTGKSGGGSGNFSGGRNGSGGSVLPEGGSDDGLFPPNPSGSGITVTVPAPPPNTGQPIIPNCTDDSDVDGISDFYEGRIEVTPELSPDIDGDGIPNYLDTDSDGDRVPDSYEGYTGPLSLVDPCKRPRDTDHDGFPDFIDVDSDGDGARDDDELRIGTDPLIADSDGDGCLDLVAARGAGLCDRKANRVVSGGCPNSDGQGSIEQRVVLSVDRLLSGETPVSLDAAPPPGLTHVPTEVTLIATAVEPADGAVIEEGRVVSVKPGARIGVLVRVTPAAHNLFVPILLTNQDVGVVAAGSLVLVPLANCPEPS